MAERVVAEAVGITELIDLTGKRAFVTGGGQGIGMAIARRLVEAGAVVIIGDLDPAAQAAAAAIGAGFAACDITEPDQLDAALDVVTSAGGLDIVVNNAGIFPTTGPMIDVTDAFIHRMLDVNVRAQFSVAREAARRMQHGGSIVNLASIAGLGGGANISAYSASKAAVISLTRSFANELGPRGIRVNAIAPGIIDTPGVQDQLAPLQAGGVDITQRIAANPLGIAGQSDHVARVALFLVSELAEFVTGHTLIVDGGATA
ncbi:SDR family NAD(P)-dependent oxidoreductase [uncultured Ilumatobacter sp.]|jgi:NAD(P)-dependent dehydrogenase (short-subunit alcohol dehydrogenase family)|uniref:SDR family NAD(P)-dependent oxidoreductase n=1 Tax=uncultured Ilumatobacter sp. TaxID=879968 RepID=UPI00374FBC5C